MADTVIELEGAAQIFDRTRNVMESAKACSALQRRTGNT
jgi:hypothetical protein